MDLGFRGKTALVTGASRGIGKAIAEGLAGEGCDLVLVARDVAAMTELSCDIAERHGVRVSAIVADLATMVDAMKLKEHLDRVDILVNNAGAIPTGALGALSEEQAREAMELKLFVYMRLASQCFEAMSARGSGVILNVIGTTGDRPRAGYALGSMVNASLVSVPRRPRAPSRMDTRSCWAHLARRRSIRMCSPMFPTGLPRISNRSPSWPACLRFSS